MGQTTGITWTDATWNEKTLQAMKEARSKSHRTAVDIQHYT